MAASSSGILPCNLSDVCFVRLWVVHWAKVHGTQKPIQLETCAGSVEYEYRYIQCDLYHQVSMKQMNTKLENHYHSNEI